MPITSYTHTKETIKYYIDEVVTFLSKPLVRDFVHDGLICAPLFFIGLTMILAMIPGGSFMIGTHAFTLFEGIIYGLGLMGISSYEFIQYRSR